MFVEFEGPGLGGDSEACKLSQLPQKDVLLRMSPVHVDAFSYFQPRGTQNCGSEGS